MIQKGFTSHHFFGNKIIKLFVYTIFIKKSGVGFSLVNLVISITIITILAVAVIVAVDPVKRFGDANTLKRKTDIRAIEKAIEHYALENQAQASNITNLNNNQPYMIVLANGTYNSPVTCNEVVGDINTTTLSDLVPDYLATVPIDPDFADPASSGTGYYIRRKGNVAEVARCTDTYNFDDGLVGLWHMDNNWEDGEGSNDLTAANGATFTTTAKMGSHAGDFNVVTDAYVADDSVTGLPSGNIAKTIMAWAYASSGFDATGMIGGFGVDEASDPPDSYGKNFQLAITTAAFKLYGWAYDWNIWDVDNSEYLGAWHLYTVTYDPPTTKLYIDTTLKKSTSDYIWNTDPQKVVLGNEIDCNSKKFEGQIDEFAIWDRALSSDEIRAIYDRQK